MTYTMKNLIGILVFAFTTSVLAQQSQVNQLRFWTDEGHTRLVLETSKAVKYKLMKLSSPHRLVVDLSNVKLKTRIPKNHSDKPYVKRIRSGVRNGKDLRLVLDLTGPAKYKTFRIEKEGKHGDRIVVDLFASAKAMRAAKKATPVKRAPVKIQNKKMPVRATPSEQIAKKKVPNRLLHATGRDLIIAIDAGHGGKDSGALGKHGGKEKYIALAIAKKMAHYVNKEKGMRAILVRKGDYFIPLKKRVEIAQKHEADLFVSIHADAFATTQATGASVYTLSNKGATSAAAKLLAQRENRSDLIGGVELKQQSSSLATLLIDLAQTGSMEASFEVAGSVLSELKRVGNVHNRRVQKAGFAVLKSASMPSILVETAYISNPAEERKLKSAGHQRTLAKSILKGVKRYFYRNPVPGTLMAGQNNVEYIVSGGDTLEQVASRFKLNVSQLKSYNALSSNQVRVGQVLQIPR